MTINLSIPIGNPTPELKPRITVIGVGGAGGNAINNMIRSKLEGVEFIAANTDAQALAQSSADRRVQLGITVTQGLGAGSRPDIGRIAAEEALEEIIEELRSSNMAFIAAGMGGGTGTGAAPVIARAAREQGILTVGVVTKPFHFEGAHRMRIAEEGINELEQFVDTLIIIPNQNLFRVANERTTFADAFKMADDVLHSGVRGVTDLMVMPGLINLDFADIRAVMSEMGKAMMGTGEAEGERRALDAAEAAISNPLLDDVSMKGARGVLINITGGPDMTLFEVDEAANRVRSEVDQDAFIIFGSTFDDAMNGKIRVSVVATGMDIIAAKSTTKLSVSTTADGTRMRSSSTRDAVGVDAAASSPDLGAVEFGKREAAMAEKPMLAELGHDKANVQAGASAPLHEADRDVFIPPAPMTSRSAGLSSRSADSYPAQETMNASRLPEAETQKPKVKSLFSKMAEAGRSLGMKPERAIESDEGRPYTAHRQPRLGALHPEERLPASQPQEDLLDIPAFLRRQAN